MNNFEDADSSAVLFLRSLFRLMMKLYSQYSRCRGIRANTLYTVIVFVSIYHRLIQCNPGFLLPLALLMIQHYLSSMILKTLDFHHSCFWSAHSMLTANQSDRSSYFTQLLPFIIYFSIPLSVNVTQDSC